MQNSKLKIITIATSALILLIAVILSIIQFVSESKNPYGNSINIRNYDSVVKNLSKDYKDSISSALFNIVKDNSPEASDKDLSKINDAYIRKDSAKQDEVSRGENRYTGSFIVDIESIHQSYKVQYSYSPDPDDPILVGYPILVDCVENKDIIYKDFKCNSFIQNEGPSDPILLYLPYQSLDFSLTADTSSEFIIINAEMNIPESDLSGNEESRREVVSMYKEDIRSWIKGNGLNPDDYAIIFNYSDDGAKS